MVLPCLILIFTSRGECYYLCVADEEQKLSNSSKGTQHLEEQGEGMGPAWAATPCIPEGSWQGAAMPWEEHR